MEYSIMKLHEDEEVFSELVGVTAETIGLPQIYVEKDYWVTKALKFLSESSHIDEVVFKGGTSLSKAYRLIDRFSIGSSMTFMPVWSSIFLTTFFKPLRSGAVITNHRLNRCSRS